MKLRKIIASACLGALLVTSIPAHAGDPCETVLCMWGKLKGANPSECSGPIKDYFSIIKKKRGDIRWGKTSNARQDYLDSCPQADSSKTKQINNKFGKMRG